MRFLLLFLAGMSSLAAQNLDTLVDRYFDEYFHLNPSEATRTGFHEPYDSQLEDYSKSGYEKQIALSRKYLALFNQLPSSDDRDLMVAHLKGSLLNLEQIRQQITNPDIYSSGVTASVFGLISRKYAAPEVRLRAVVARERKIPEVLQCARQNLANPPRIYTQVAIEQLPGLRSFFAHDVPGAFTSVQDPKLVAEFKQVNASVDSALSDYETWLKNNLLPRSKGDFRIGADVFRKKVAYDEMVDMPIDKLLEIGYANLRANQDALKHVSARIDPSKTPQAIAEKLGMDHPVPDQLLQSFRDTFNGLIAFINQHRIITIPSQVRPILEETPPFMRALTTASMDTPGPYEKVATEAYFNVTLPEKSWSAQRTAEFMSAFGRGTIVSTAIHESYPGHYVQLLWFKDVPGKLRKLVGCNSNIEGWAHYTEQMMLDEGYKSGDLELRAGQLMDALLRNCRYIVGIEMHTGKMSFEQGVEFFMREGFMSRDYSERETKRGTSDPTYLVYTLGKLEILKLRDDYRKKMGSNFSLEDFHNRFMQQGGVPIKLIRHSMLNDHSPVL